MGSLVQRKTGRRHTLNSRHLIGRSRRCDLRLPHRSVSGEHAVIWWDKECWMLRDLGSRNGTMVDGASVEPAQPVQLSTGAALRFGDYPLTWELESAAGPVPLAVEFESGAVVEAVDNILALPNHDEPSTVIYGDENSGWELESGEEVRSVGDLDHVSVAGTLWRLHLPQQLQPTADESSAPMQVVDLGLEFEVSADEEHISLSARSGARLVDLGSRAHHYLLLVLARARLVDAELDPTEQGWVYQDELCKMLRYDREQVNMAVYRARKHLARTGIANARDIVERRTDSRQLRLGVAQLVIRQG